MTNDEFQIPNSESGQSLFEVVVTIAISALIIVAVVSAVIVSIQNANFSKNKSVAASYVQETSEWLRGQRDANITTFIANAENLAAIDPKTGLVTWCFPDSSWTHPGICSDTNFITGTSFIRQATFENIGVATTIIQADVSVSWTDSGGTHVVSSSIELADWRQR